MLFLVFINALCLYDNYLVAQFWRETADYQSSSTSLLLSWAVNKVGALPQLTKRWSYSVALYLNPGIDLAEYAVCAALWIVFE